MPTQEKMALVMPVYNEEGRLERTLEEWTLHFEANSNKFAQVILVAVNDGSKDGSGKILDSWAKSHAALRVIHQKNQGHGPAICRGYTEALNILGADRHTWVFQVDSDGQFGPKDFETIWQARQDQWFVAGHRQERHDPFYRLIISAFLRAIVAAVYGVYCADANVPYRLMRGDFLQMALQWIPPETFAPNIMLTVMAKSLSKSRDGICIEHLARTTGTVSILRWRLIKACLKSAWQLLCFRATMNKWKQALTEKLISSSSVPGQQA